MRSFIFAKRCAKEILRDPLNVAFGLGFPSAVLLLLTTIGKNIPSDIFNIELTTPGVAAFGLSFMTLFSATLISRDRESAFAERLYTTPLKPLDFILGYMLPLIPIAVAEAAVCFAVAIALGQPVTVNILYAILFLLPTSVFYIALGLLCGSLLNVKQVGGICGALLTNLTAWLSGAWFDLSLVGGAFLKIADILPFSHAVTAARAALAGDIAKAGWHALPVTIYAAIVLALAVLFFLRQMRRR